MPKGALFGVGKGNSVMTLVVKPDETSSGLQAIKANPSKPSVDAMLTLLDKLRVIEATGVLGVDLLWLNGNYQRALFHRV
jgi:hypothetical protein